MKDMCSNIGSDVTRPTPVPIEGSEAGQNVILITHSISMTANVEGGHRSAPGSEVIDDSGDVVAVEVEINYAEEGAKVRAEALQEAEDCLVGDLEGLQKGEAGGKLGEAVGVGL